MCAGQELNLHCTRRVGYSHLGTPMPSRRIVPSGSPRDPHVLGGEFLKLLVSDNQRRRCSLNRCASLEKSSQENLKNGNWQLADAESRLPRRKLDLIAESVDCLR